MTLQQVRIYLEGANGKQIKLGLGPITRLMEALDWPDKALRIIHVTGTNGKGSTCEMMSQILQSGGYQVGTFNSPYFEVVNECIRINNQLISDEALLGLMNEIEPILQDLEKQGLLPTGFEILTVLALIYFKQKKVDFVILEVGLGGRLDATNVIGNSALSVITKIAMDHQNILGNSLEAIAKEKSGIIKQEGLVVALEQTEEVMEVITTQCKAQNASLVTLSSKEVCDICMRDEGVSFKFKGQKYSLGIYGIYQAYNASVAITAIETLNTAYDLGITKLHIKKGLSHMRWAGRFEKVSSQPLCFIDGAHNVDGVLALSQTLSCMPKRHTIAIVGILKDKEIEEMLEMIMPYIDQWVVTRPLNPRAEEPKQLAEKIQKYTSKVIIKEDVREAFEEACKEAQQFECEHKESMIIGFGSLYMLGALRAVVLRNS